MADVFTKAKRSQVMSRIRGRGNKDTELALIRVFRAERITGWRRQVSLALKVSGSGKPTGRRPTRSAERGTRNPMAEAGTPNAGPRTANLKGSRHLIPSLSKKCVQPHGPHPACGHPLPLLRARDRVEAERAGTPNLTPQTSNSKPQVFKVRPDFVFPKLRLAVFVDGCFWHGCPKHATKPRNNAAFWRKKLASNQARDRLVTRTLRQRGWRVLRIWEHELTRRNQPRLVKRLKKEVRGVKGEV